MLQIKCSQLEEPQTITPVKFMGLHVFLFIFLSFKAIFYRHFFKWHYSVIGVENCSLAAVSDNGDCASANNSSKLQEKPILTTGIISQSALFLPFM